MVTLARDHVSVWLDESAPLGGAFAHALEWAAHLRLPLQVVTALPPSEQLQACAAACQRQGVPWEAVVWQGSLASAVERFLRPAEFCVLGKDLFPHLRGELLRRSVSTAPTALLVCPRSWQPLSRVLVLNQPVHPTNHFLETVAEIVRAFQVRPVVLTLGWCEREAQRRQRLTEERLERQGLSADFDLIVGCDVRTAVAWAARWRHCSHVVLQRRHSPLWWRWFRGDTLEALLDLADRLTFLALPNMGLQRTPVEKAEAGQSRDQGKLLRAKDRVFPFSGGVL